MQAFPRVIHVILFIDMSKYLRYFTEAEGSTFQCIKHSPTCQSLTSMMYSLKHLEYHSKLKPFCMIFTIEIKCYGLIHAMEEGVASSYNHGWLLLIAGAITQHHPCTSYSKNAVYEIYFGQIARYLKHIAETTRVSICLLSLTYVQLSIHVWIRLSDITQSSTIHALVLPWWAELVHTITWYCLQWLWMLHNHNPL